MRRLVELHHVDIGRICRCEIDCLKRSHLNPELLDARQPRTLPISLIRGIIPLTTDEMHLPDR